MKDTFTNEFNTCTESLLFIADFVKSILLILALKKYQVPLQSAQVTRRRFNSNIRWISIPFPIK